LRAYSKPFFIIRRKTE